MLCRCVRCALCMLPGKGVIVDSGTTDTYLPRTVAAAFKREFKKASSIKFGFKFKIWP